ncbi:DUF1877 family protein [Streptomyces nigra]|uniref:DUF1877 family protein n=1 Tax=Streptomyces nigra TaxID=1827580 RepID=UPI00341EA32B
MSVGFVSATAEELDRAWREPEWAEPYVWELYDSKTFRRDGRLDCGPAKAWAGLQFLFDAADVRLEFLMDGFMIAEDGTLFGWTVEQFTALAAELRETPWERPAAHYDPERMARDDVYPNLWAFDPGGQREWLQAAYEELVAFVTGAAERGQGAFMSFAY